MKHYSSMLLVILFSVALMQLYRAHVELECQCEVLAFEVKGHAGMLEATTRHFSERTQRNAQKTAELEAKLAASTTAKNTAYAPR